jgi:E1A/CREB-binding protein
MLRKATNEGIVVELTNLYEHFFNPKTECKAKVTAARLPYFDGDYWPGAAEDIINQIFLPEDDRNLQKKGKLKKTITKRALKIAGLTDLNGNASKDAMLMQKVYIFLKIRQDMFFPPSFISVLILNHQLMLHSSEKPFTQ